MCSSNIVKMGQSLKEGMAGDESNNLDLLLDLEYLSMVSWKAQIC